MLRGDVVGPGGESGGHQPAVGTVLFLWRRPFMVSLSNHERTWSFSPSHKLLFATPNQGKRVLQFGLRRGVNCRRWNHGTGRSAA